MLGSELGAQSTHLPYMVLPMYPVKFSPLPPVPTENSIALKKPEQHREGTNSSVSESTRRIVLPPAAVQ